MTRFYQTKFFKAGIPFMIFMVGASFAMTIITDIRYMTLKRHNNAGLTREQKRKILFDYARDSSQEKPLKEVIDSKTLEIWKGDPQVKAVLEELIEKPLIRKEFDPKDPEYQRRLAKLKKIQNRKSYTIEDAYNELREEQDLNNWENKRIPRPWEEKDEV